MTPDAMERFCALLRAETTDRICFACHVSPDGDTLGSAFALARLCRDLGKAAFVYVPDPIPPSLQFLAEGFDNTPFEPEVCVAVDVSAPDRLGRAFPYADRLLAVLDHHAGNTFETDIKVTDSAKCATGVLVAEVYDRMGLPIGADAARALYTAVSTDTGRFCHANTNAEAFALAARLAEAVPEGNFGELNRRLFVSKDRRALRLEGYLLTHAVLNEEAGYAYFALTGRLARRFGIDLARDDLFSLVDTLRSFGGFDTYFLAKEKEPGTFKISVRTEGEAVTANAIAAVFGGGGHTRAAGCVIRAKSARAVEKALAAALSGQRGK